LLKEVKEKLNGDVTGLTIQSDGGNEFKDRFHNELTRRKVKHYYGVPGKPASQSMVERLNQTIKGKLKRLWRARGVLAQKPWDESTIQAIVASHNDQVHSALPKGVTPTDVMDAIDEDPTGLIEKVKEHQQKVWGRKKGKYEQKWIDEGNQSKYKVGDIVRTIFAQPDKYDTQWSVTLYEIAKVTKPRNPVLLVTYKLKRRGAAADDFIAGTFTRLELQTVPLNKQGYAQESGVPAGMLNLDDEANRDYTCHCVSMRKGSGRPAESCW
jgi:hypothetical protein